MRNSSRTQSLNRSPFPLCCLLILISLFSSVLMSLALYLVNHKHTIALAVGSLAKAHPRNGTTTACIAKMHLVARVVRFNGRHHKSNLAIVIKTECSIVKAGRVDSPFCTLSFNSKQFCSFNIIYIHNPKSIIVRKRNAKIITIFLVQFIKSISVSSKFLPLVV